jgi:hypothetical protein
LLGKQENNEKIVAVQSLRFECQEPGHPKKKKNEAQIITSEGGFE